MRQLVLLIILIALLLPIRAARAEGPLSADEMKQIALQGGIRIASQPSVLGSITYDGVGYTLAEYSDGARTGLVIAADAGQNGRSLLLDEMTAREVICRWNWQASVRALSPSDANTIQGLAQTGSGVRGGLEAARVVIGTVRDAVTALQNYQKNLAGIPGGSIVIDLLNKLDGVINLRSMLESLSGQLVDLDKTLSDSSQALGRVVVDFDALRTGQPVSCQQVDMDVTSALDLLGKLQPRIRDVTNLLGALTSGLNTLESQLRDRGVPDLLISPLSGARGQMASAQNNLTSLNQSVVSAQNALTQMQNQVNTQNRVRLDQWRYRPNPFGIPGFPNLSLPDLPTYVWVLAILTAVVGLLFLFSLAAAMRHRNHNL